MNLLIEYKAVGGSRNAKCVHCGEPKSWHTQLKLTDGRVKWVCREVQP